MYFTVDSDGITHKNLTSNPSAGIGLNPNLNIEDEYIENLLKQVHFLNMEIKLMYVIGYSARRSKKKIRGWELWVCLIRIKIQSLLMLSLPTKNTLI
jgi:hypothetical protein